MSPVNQSIAEKGTKCNAAGKEARQAVYRYTGIALPGVRRGGDSQGKHRWALSACIGILGRRSASLFARVSLSRTFILRFFSRWEMHAGVVRNHWYTEQAFSQLQRLCPALPGVRQPPSSARGTCIVVPHAALLAVPDAPPRFFAHWARSAPVPLGAPVCEPSQVQCCTLADHGPGAQNPVWFQKEEPPHVWGFFLLESGSVLLSRAVTSQVPSALKGLTSVFGMGTGGSLSP